MARAGLCLAAIILLLPIIFSASFTDCFPNGKLEQFWLSPLYWSSNPNVFHLGFFDVYKPELDQSLSSLGIENLSIEDPQSILRSVSVQDEPDLKPAASSLLSAQQSLSAAKVSRDEAHRVLTGTQNIKDLTDLAVRISGFGGLAQFHSYITGYPPLFSSTLTASANAYDSVHASGFDIAQRLDHKLSELELAGAGKAAYSGKAKEPYFYARSLLSNTEKFCALSNEQEISEYFSTRPHFPGFSEPGFAIYLERTAGKGENTTIIRMAQLYGRLSEARRQMEAEYTDARATAVQSVSELQGRVTWLSTQRLDLIGDPVSSTPSGTAIAGTGFSGIYQGMLDAQLALGESNRLIKSSETLHNEAKASNYLADAISQLAAADGMASSAISSAESVRSDAESAVEAEKLLAEQAITDADRLASSPPSGFSDAAQLQSAKILIGQANAKLSSAARQPTLGQKFEAYQGALQLAVEAKARLEKRIWLPLSEAAKIELASLKSFLKNAESDGLDVSYELAMLTDYNSLLTSASTPDLVQEVLEAVRSDKESVRLRLYEKYSDMEDDYASTGNLVRAIRETEPAFLPGFDSLTQFFPSGRLDVQAFAGQLKGTQAKLSDYRNAAEQKLPIYLSYILSKNARVQELSSQPVLGKPTKYSANIITGNPSEFGYSGKLDFTARTALPLYSADFSSGDSLRDAYPDSGKTTISIQGVRASSSLSFGFERDDQPAQISSSTDSCSLATQGEAAIVRSIDFSSSRRLDSLRIEEAVPQGARNGQLKFASRQVSAEPVGESLIASIGPVSEGKSTLSLSFSVPSPFNIALGQRSYETVPGGAKKVSFDVTVDPLVDCTAAQVELYEPSASVSTLAVLPLSAHKVSDQHVLPRGGTSTIQFSISPQRIGQQARFTVSYLITSTADALDSALQQSELQVKLYGRERDSQRLSQARQLIALNQTDEALSLLSQIGQEGVALVHSYADYQEYLAENESAGTVLSSISDAQAELLSSNLTQQSASLSSISLALSSALSQAGLEAGEGNAAKAVSSVRKARGKASSDLAELAWKSSKEASDKYAAARKASTGSDGAGLSDAERSISLSQQYYSQGGLLQSFLFSARALGSLLSLSQQSQDEGLAALQEANGMAAVFSDERKEADELLASYSSFYSALSGASKKQLALSPAAVQKKLDELDKSILQVSSGKLEPHQSLALAASSLSKLREIKQSLQSSLDSVRATASSQLSVAQAALSESRQKASSSDEEQLSALESELSKAESLYADAMYADSIMSSQRAISAAASFLSKKTSAGIDGKAVLLAGISIAFIVAAAYYFMKGRNPTKPHEKKGLPKAD